MLFEIFCFRTLTFELSQIGISKNQRIRVFRGLKKIKTRALGFTERKTLPMQLNFSFTYGRYIFNIFNANDMIGSVSFLNCKP